MPDTSIKSDTLKTFPVQSKLHRVVLGCPHFLPLSPCIETAFIEVYYWVSASKYRGKSQGKANTVFVQLYSVLNGTFIDILWGSSDDPITSVELG